MNQAGNMTHEELEELMKNVEGMKVETQQKISVDFK
jgi:hypothetical protein